MIAPLIAAGIAALSGAGAVGFLFGRGARDVRARAAASVEALDALDERRVAAEKEAREASTELARLRGMSLAGRALTGSTLYEGRAAPRDAEELARLLRGLALVDDVVLADRSGHAMTREAGATSAHLAALAPRVLLAVRRLASEGIPVASLSFETLEAAHVEARLLAGRGEGLLLLVRTTSVRVSPLVMDAVAHAASRTGPAAPERGSAATSLRGNGDSTELEETPLSNLQALLQRELASGLTALTLAVDERPVLSVASDGPSVHARAAAATELSALAASAARTLHAIGMARIEVAVAGGFTMVWAPLGPRSRASITTFAPADAQSPARLDRLLGTLRRNTERSAFVHGADGSAT